jgi:hypothetical protein
MAVLETLSDGISSGDVFNGFIFEGPLFFERRGYRDLTVHLRAARYDSYIDDEGRPHHLQLWVDSRGERVSIEVTEEYFAETTEDDSRWDGRRRDGRPIRRVESEPLESSSLERPDEDEVVREVEQVLDKF